LEAPFPVSAFGDRNYIEIHPANRSQDYVHAPLADNRIQNGSECDSYRVSQRDISR
jgi:hypothetical protein